MPAAWRACAAWAAVIVPTWIVLALCTHWEPVVRDSWGHVWWHHATDVSLYEFAKDTYLHNNPRIGQVITWLLFSPGPWHVIVTPLVELAMFYGLAVLVLGRWPSVRRADDALVVAMLVAMVLATCPLVGPMLFYRPFSGNYLYGLVLNLALLVPYRLHLERALTQRWLAPVVFVVGMLAGLANEHTDPALVALCGLAIVLAWRRKTLAPWMIAGLVGVLAGAALLFLAPGQNLRYEGLATQQSLVERITARGAGNLDIFTLLLRYLRPLAIWLGLAALCAFVGGAPRRIPRIAWLLAATALVITLTLLASPKQGPRLYLASVAFVGAAVATIVHAQLERSWHRALAWGLAAVLAGRIAIKLVMVYASVGPEAHERLEQILTAKPGSTLELAPYSQPRSRWFMGDDFLYPKWRDFVGEGFGIVKIQLTGAVQPTGPADDDL
jgi:hypothetical protein